MHVDQRLVLVLGGDRLGSRPIAWVALIAALMCAAINGAVAQSPSPPLPVGPQRVCLSVDVLNALMGLAQENADLAQAKFLNVRQRVLADAQWQALPPPPAPAIPGATAGSPK